MTRLRWTITRRLTNLYYNNRVFGYIIVLFTITALLLCLGYCSIRSLNQPFEGVNFRSIYAPEIDGSVLVTFERYGEILGHKFPDRYSALAFVESIR